MAQRLPDGRRAGVDPAAHRPTTRRSRPPRPPSTSGTAKALLKPGNALVGGFLAGAYIAFGGLLAVVARRG